MNSSDFSRSIRRSWELFSELGLGLSFSMPTSLPPHEEVHSLALSSSAKYEDLFRFSLSESHYNFVLDDRSFFQFSMSGRENVRYAFFPNPYASDFEGECNESIDDLEVALMSSSQAEVDIRRPLIRYEYAPTQWREFSHPCAHFHLGHDAENRWAVRRFITPFAFALLIAKHFYHDKWHEVGAAQNAHVGNRFEAALITERTECRRVDSNWFTIHEERTFYFE